MSSMLDYFHNNENRCGDKLTTTIMSTHIAQCMIDACLSICFPLEAYNYSNGKAHLIAQDMKY